MNISIKEDTLLVFKGDDQICKVHVEYLSRSKKHVLIYGSPYDCYKQCSILISYLTGYVYMNIPYGDLYLLQVIKIGDIEIDIQDTEEVDEFSLMNTIQTDVINLCIQYAPERLHFDTSKIPIINKYGYLPSPDISVEYMSDYLDTEEGAIGYAYLLHLYKKYGLAAIEYLWIM